MTVVPFPLDPDMPLSVLGRDDARLVRQSGLNVVVVCLDNFGRPFSTTIPIWRLRLGKRSVSLRGFFEQDEGKLPSRFAEDARPGDTEKRAMWRKCDGNQSDHR